jgi:CHAT domain-containing protein
MGLVTEFYQQLKKSRIKAEALQKAQIEMLNKRVKIEKGKLVWSGGSANLTVKLTESNNLSHPYYWAPFTMIGNPW